MREYQVKHRGKMYRTAGHEPSEYISSYLNKGIFYEEPLLTYLEDKYPNLKSVVDVGANVGNHSAFFKKVMRVKEVVAFEPNEDNFRIAEALMGRTMPILNVALSDKAGRATSHSSPGNMGASYCISDEEGTIEVQTLDSYELSPDLIKIDAENMESQVLFGAKETIQRSKPILIVEHNDIQKMYEFNRVLNQIDVPYMVKPFTKKNWEMFEYIPVERL